MKGNPISKILIALGSVCIVAAFGIVAMNMQEQQSGEESAKAALVPLKAEIPPQETIQEEMIPDYILNPNMDMPEVVIDDVAYIGYLEIPALELELPVITETTYRYLNIAPCRYSGSAYLDDLVIGAHNYKGHFRYLKDLTYGDEVIFTDVDGNVFTYQIANMETLNPTQVEELTAGEWPLTLYTCTVGGRTRLIIRCEKIQ